MATVDPRGQQKSARCHSYVYTRSLWRLTHTHPIPQWLQEIAQPGAGARGGDASVPAWLQEIARPETGARAATVPVLALRQQGGSNGSNFSRSRTDPETFLQLRETPEECWSWRVPASSQELRDNRAAASNQVAAYQPRTYSDVCVRCDRELPRDVAVLV